MRSVSRFLLAVLGLLGAGLGTGAAFANSGVQDPAKLFSADAIRRADDQIQKLKRDHKKEIFIETLEALPSPEKGGPDLSNKQATTKWVNDFALGRAKAQSVNGVYLLLIKNPGKFQFEIGNKTLQKEFTLSDRDEVIRKIQPLLKENKMDEVLDTLVGFISAKMAQHQTVGARTPHPGQPVNHVVAENREANPWAGYLCLGLLVLGGIMLVMGLMRGLMGGGGGGMAGGPGMAPGYGGGGFMSNMLGGMFGAAAGMWIYDSFFGHGGSRAWGSGNEGNTGGGDYGDSSSGQDTDYSGSGGDWSGGGDNSGGGDWGGGGGDWGGGGGGDFGGGGGGDY